MSDNKNAAFSYAQTSNLVLSSSRHRQGGSSEPTGEVESLWGKLGSERMGGKVGRKGEDKKRGGDEKKSAATNKKRKASAPTPSSQPTSTAPQSLKTLTSVSSAVSQYYTPQTPSAKASHSSLLTLLTLYLGPQPPDILASAAEEVLLIYKDDDLTSSVREREVTTLLGLKSGVDRDIFRSLTDICRGIDDFDFNGDDQAVKIDVDNDGEDEGDKGLSDMGVAVVFDDDDEDSDDEEDDNEGRNVKGKTYNKEINSDGESNDDDGESSDSDDDEKSLAQSNDENKVKEAKMKKNINPHEIDKHYIQRLLSPFYPSPPISLKLSLDVLEILALSDKREVENKLVVLLGFDKFEVIKKLVEGKVVLYYCVRLTSAENDEARVLIETEMLENGGDECKLILDELNKSEDVGDWGEERIRRVKEKGRLEADNLSKKEKNLNNVNVGDNDDVIDEDVPDDVVADTAEQESANAKKPSGIGAHTIDLDSLVFKEGSRLMSNTKCTLPPTSWRAMKPGYEEVHCPAVKSIIGEHEKLVNVTELPEWSRKAFVGMSTLNRLQSKMINIALYETENLLLCAPTGAGKTNVAMLAMLNILSQNINPDGSLDLKSFKIVYVAPMKALVQEVVKNFGKRLAGFGITVRELSGDSSLTRQEISDTQVIVTTPEKWDIITRKSDDRTYTQLVKLVIIDEIHLLHDERGPVLESIVSRTIRQVETSQEPIRIVGLSATLPNYEDVATFLRVKVETGLFFFDQSFRPVPLQMQYIGITEKKALKRHTIMNEICYEKVLLQQRDNNQVLIFVHSRAECAKTAKALRDLAIENDTLTQFVREDGASHEILTEEVETVKNADLRDVLPYGFAIHHAGMVRSDRELVEDLFADNHIKVLISTATLAWGVNLPAHSVIIKGTQMYNPEKGMWVELSPLDVQQMLGRAGRPQFDSEGEGIIITQHSELQYYLSLTQLQLPVESQMIKVLPNHLNAEVVAGSITSIEEAIEWLGYSYLFVRMLKNPELYGINPDIPDPLLKQRRLDLAHSAACLLEKSQLVRYDRKSGAIQSTALGKVASHYYISHESMAIYNQYLKPTMSDIELLRLFAMSGEFAQIPVRADEKIELQKLAQRVPIPVKESVDEPSAKVNILLQAYISRLSLEGYALLADMSHVQQSAGRIMRCLFEISIKRGWAELARLTLDFSKMVQSRMWRSQSPLRQFKGVPDIVARKLERKDIPFERYVDLKPADLGELVGAPKMGKTLHRLVNQFPRLELAATVQPITRSMLRVELTITPDFEFDVKVHDYAQLFWIIVEDVNGENILHHEMFMLKADGASIQHYVTFSVPVLDPLPPQYFVKVISDRWLHSEAVIPINFRHLILPQKFPPHTPLLDLQPLPISALNSKVLQTLYTHIPNFNPIQTQTFQDLFNGDNNVLICAPTGSGKTICAEFAILRMLSYDKTGKCVYVIPKDEVVAIKSKDFAHRFKAVGINVCALTGETAPDLKLMEASQIIFATCAQWDAMSRRWKQRKVVQNLNLIIFDEIHLIGGGEGPVLEVIISRMRYIASQLTAGGVTKKMRMLGLGASLANAKDIGDWMGVKSSSNFNFSPKVRPVPLEIYLQSFDVQNFSSRMLAMGKPTFNAVRRYSEEKPVLVFVPSRRQAQLTAIDLMTYASSAASTVTASGKPFSFLNDDVTEESITSVVENVKEPALAQTLTHGIGFLHQGMSMSSDRNVVEGLFKDGAIQVLIAPFDMCWQLDHSAYLVVVMGTESFEGKEQRYVDHSIADMLQMMGKAGRPLEDTNAKCMLLCHTPKKEHLKKLLYEPLPVESHFDSYLHDHFCSEVTTKTIESQQDAVDYLTWSFMYRRLSKNPNYYNLSGTSPSHLSDHLSEMVEVVLDDLKESKCIAINEDEDSITPLNLGMIAAYYYINYTTIELIASSVTAKTKTRGIVEILSAANEFTKLSIRQNEDKTLKSIARTLPQGIGETAAFNDPNTKALVLLQCHFSRKNLSTDLLADQKVVVGDSVRILQAIVDVISSQGFLKPALAAMEVSQMIVQGLWSKDNILRQIPHFTADVVQRCIEHGNIESPFDILELEEEVRNKVLMFGDEKMQDVAIFCNNFPVVDLKFTVVDADDVKAGEAMRVSVVLTRDIDEEDEDEDVGQLGIVSAPLYHKQKTESWWIVLGSVETNTILSIKRTTLQKVAKLNLDCIAPETVGKCEFKIYLMSDSYLGVDQEFEVAVEVGEGGGSESESGSDEEE